MFSYRYPAVGSINDPALGLWSGVLRAQMQASRARWRLSIIAEALKVRSDKILIATYLPIHRLLRGPARQRLVAQSGCKADRFMGTLILALGSVTRMKATDWRTG